MRRKYPLLSFRHKLVGGFNDDRTPKQSQHLTLLSWQHQLVRRMERHSILNLFKSSDQERGVSPQCLTPMSWCQQPVEKNGASLHLNLVKGSEQEKGASPPSEPVCCVSSKMRAERPPRLESNRNVGKATWPFDSFFLGSWLCVRSWPLAFFSGSVCLSGLVLCSWPCCVVWLRPPVFFFTKRRRPRAPSQRPGFSDRPTTCRVDSPWWPGMRSDDPRTDLFGR